MEVRIFTKIKNATPCVSKILNFVWYALIIPLPQINSNHLFIGITDCFGVKHSRKDTHKYIFI